MSPGNEQLGRSSGQAAHRESSSVPSIPPPSIPAVMPPPALSPSQSEEWLLKQSIEVQYEYHVYQHEKYIYDASMQQVRTFEPSNPSSPPSALHLPSFPPLISSKRQPVEHRDGHSRLSASS